MTMSLSDFKLEGEYVMFVSVNCAYKILILEVRYC